MYRLWKFFNYIYAQIMNRTTMNQHNFNRQNTLYNLINEYEAMSQKGTVGFIEEKVFIDLISYYEKQSSFDKALSVVDHAISQHNYSSDLLICKARLLSDAKKYREALDCLDRAFALMPTDTSIQVLRSEVLCSLGRHEEALSILENIDNNSNSAPDKLFWTKAIIHEKLLDYKEMFSSLQYYLIINPRNVNALRKVWVCVEMFGNYKESIAFHEELIDLDPYSYLAWHNLGHAYSKLGNYKKAAWAFEYSYIINPTFESGYLDYANACVQIGSYDKALRCYEDLLEHFEANNKILLRIGQCYELKQDYGVAQAFYEKSLDMNNQCHELYFRMGECYSKRKLWDAAIDTYEEAIRLESHNENYYAAIAEAYFQIGEDEKANTYFQKAADTAPDEPEYWMTYATFLMKCERYDDVLEVIEEAGYYCTGTELEFCKAACLYCMDKREEALNALKLLLTDHYDKHELFIDLIPNVERHQDIIDLINFHCMN